jgi:hypothetical protein
LQTLSGKDPLHLARLNSGVSVGNFCPTTEYIVGINASSYVGVIDKMATTTNGVVSSASFFEKEKQEAESSRDAIDIYMVDWYPDNIPCHLVTPMTSSTVILNKIISS